MSDWHRADLGDLPEVGAEIILVVYPADSQHVIVRERMIVAVVMERDDKTGVYGPTLLNANRLDIVLPPRPEEFSGPMALLWREYR